jgi:endoglucanase
MERMAQGSIDAALDTAYLTNYSVAVNYITENGGYAVIDPHNYGRYNGNIINNTAAFQTFWSNLATHFKSNSKVVSTHSLFPLLFQVSMVEVDNSRSLTQTTSITTWMKP